MSDLEGHVFPAAAPFEPASRWRGRIKDFNRQPLRFKQMVFLCIFFTIALPAWFYGFRGGSYTPQSYSDAKNGWGPLSPNHHRLLPPPGHQSQPSTSTGDAAPSHVPSQDHRPPEVVDKNISLDYDGHPAETNHTEELERVVDPMTFALIIWGEDTAAEGAILLKSILMYTSGPIHLHIICDEAAQTYIEKRLSIVPRPRFDVFVRFYRLAWQAMVDRIEREGKIGSKHAAGTPGLMKLFIHEILPTSVKKVVFVDTDAFFISDPYLLWTHFNHVLPPSTILSMPTHPEMFAPQWFDANKICSCVMLLDLEGLRRLRLMDSSHYRAAQIAAYSPPAFSELFGSPDATTGKYEGIALGDQTYWWAIIQHMDRNRVQPPVSEPSTQEAPSMFEHLHYDWEVSSCLLDMYITDLLPGKDDATNQDELNTQSHTWQTPHQHEVIVPKLVHFNCLPGSRYFDWEGWDSPIDDQISGTFGLARRWGTAVKYHVGYKWLWLNRGSSQPSSSASSPPDSDIPYDAQGPRITLETVHDVKFADELMGNN